MPPARSARRLAAACTRCTKGVWLLLSLGARPAWAHDLETDQLLLQPDFEHGELRGQLTFNPHLTAPREGNDLAARVAVEARRHVTLELDGKRCEPHVEVRELWVPAGATVGDILLLRCPLSLQVERLRVQASPNLPALVVTVEGGSSPGSQSALVGAGQWTPAYIFGRPNPSWRPGGAGQFGPEAIAALSVAAAPRTDGPLSRESGQPQGALSFQSRRAVAGSPVAWAAGLLSLVALLCWAFFRRNQPAG